MRKLTSIILTAAIMICAFSASALELNQTVDLPITDEPVTYTILMATLAQMAGANMETETDSLAYQEFFKRTGVVLDMSSPAVGAMVEAYNIMLASGEYPDIVSIGTEFGPYDVYQGGIDKAIEDGVYIRLNELVEEYMPNYWAICNSSDVAKREAFTDGGNLFGIASVFDPVQYNWYGPVVRQDWLDDLGLDVPETYDDWYEMLVLFRDEKGAEAPLILPTTGIARIGHGGHLANGFGASNDFILDEEGNVTYGPIEDGFRKYVETMHQWYAEGLIDSDFYARRASILPDTTLTNTGKSGAWLDMYTIIGNHKLQSDDPNMFVVPVPDPVENKGDSITLWRPVNHIAGPYWVISSQCEDPVPLLKALDYLYTWEGMLLANYGFEGETFEIVDGTPQYMPLVYDNPDMDVNSAMMYYQMQEAPKIYDYRKEMIGLPDEAYRAPEVWQSNCSPLEESRALPNSVSLNYQEGERSNAIMADIRTYVSENLINFIIGNRPMSEYDAFVEQIYKMGIEEAIELQQAAYTRYIER